MRIVTVEDHAMVRESIVRLLAQLSPEVMIEEYGNFDSVLEKLEVESEIDLMLLDLAMPGTDGFAALGLMRQRFPWVPVAVLSAFDDTTTIRRAIRLGASGFIPKALSGDAFLTAVQQIMRGEVWVPEQLSGALMDEQLPLPPGGGGVSVEDIGLSERQGQVLAMMMRGGTNREIAEALNLAEGTVKIHITAIFKALGVTSRAQAIVAVSHYGVRFDEVL